MSDLHVLPGEATEPLWRRALPWLAYLAMLAAGICLGPHTW